MVGLPATTWIPALLLFGAAAFGTLGLVLLWEVVRDWVERRSVRRQLAALVGEGADRQDKGSELLRGGASTGEVEEGWAARFRSLPGVRASLVLLEQADVSWGLVTLYMLMFGAAAAAGGVALTVSGSPMLATLVAAGGSLLPYQYLRRRRKLIADSFERDLPEALDLMTRAIRAGHPFTSGLQMVGEEGPDRVALEFRKTFEEHRFGLSFEDSLLGMVDRVGLVDVRIFATAVLIQRESGGNLAEILDKLSSTMRDRFSIRRQLRVYTAQGRLSGYTLAALPIVVGFLIYLLEPAYVSVLFQEAIGRVMLIAGLVMQVLGYFWIRSIVNIEI